MLHTDPGDLDQAAGAEDLAGLKNERIAFEIKKIITQEYTESMNAFSISYLGKYLCIYIAFIMYNYEKTLLSEKQPPKFRLKHKQKSVIGIHFKMISMWLTIEATEGGQLIINSYKCMFKPKIE